ncbi:MAG: hypothetical protein KGV43_02450 [Arcobacter sp.]|nr:hypothetical protein [Arcobacter sp.]
MSEADILALTYLDTMSVYRPVKEVRDGETLFLKGLEGKKVYSDIKCSLSSISGGALQDKTAFHIVDSTYKIFTYPYIEIKENDYIVLVVNAGNISKTHHLIAGKSRLFVSHIEIVVKESEKA